MSLLKYNYMIYKIIGLVLMFPFVVSLLSVVTIFFSWKKLKKVEKWKNFGFGEFIKKYGQWIVGAFVLFVLALCGLFLALM